MARIPEVELERLKAEVALERLAESRGIVLERRGQDRAGLWGVGSSTGLFHLADNVI